jgi:RNA-directed DNA polymerase
MIAKHKLASAAPTSNQWEAINWPHHEAVVKKLQVRIVKAVKQKKTGKVKSLQWLLTSSYSAKVLSIRKVTQNKGKNTPGVDGVILKTPKEKSAQIGSLKRRNYNPLPLRRIYLKKKNGKLRPIGIPSLNDRIRQQMYYLAVAPISETTADVNSFGFRPERNCADAIETLFNCLCKRIGGPQWVMEGDIKGCFDNISHAWMLNHICIDKVILSKWLKSGYIDTGKLFPTNAGSPQGGIISPCLSNLVLDGFEKLLDDNFGARRRGINFVRYADDFIITAKTREILELEIKPLVIKFLKERGLELSMEKTKITHINDGFDFLGQNMRKYPCGQGKRKLLTKPSKDNIKAFMAQIRETIRNSGQMSQASLIQTLNPKIRGWASYHKTVVSKVIFNNVDNKIWHLLWRWAVRRHPKKSCAWIKKKYYAQIGLRNGVFIGREQLDGRITQHILFRAASIPIKRHVRIKSDANPFDPQWLEYFEVRKSIKMNNSFAGRQTAISLLKRQQNKCSCCDKFISMENKWRVHLIINRLKGGNYNMHNLCIIHDNCHKNGFNAGFEYTAGYAKQGVIR